MTYIAREKVEGRRESYETVKVSDQGMRKRGRTFVVIRKREHLAHKFTEPGIK